MNPAARSAGPRRRHTRTNWRVVLGLALAAVGLGTYLPRSILPIAARPVRIGPFLATPYLQLGAVSRGNSLALLWHADDRDQPWSVAVRPGPASAWAAVPPPDHQRVAVEQVEPHRVYRATLAPLAPGEGFDYRVALGGKVVWEARGHALPRPGKPHRFVAFGDAAQDSAGQRRVAYQAHRFDPDYVVITGDIVYFRGRIAEYRPRFFPVYAAQGASPRVGAPLLGSVPFVGVAGNHDLAVNNFVENADLLAYYYYWSEPLNGPIPGPTSRLVTPLKGPADRVAAFRAASGANYPRMANFSFDAGDVHWTVLDSNLYVQWADPVLRAWVAADLVAARDRAWRFVTFHHPGFHSSRAHGREQQMRLLADVFEAGGVALVFSGHVHNYQRSRPIRFAATTYADGRAPEPGTPVDGRIAIDREYDGATRTRPDGVVYLVTGGGGAELYDRDQDDAPATWQPFTAKFVADSHSMTVVDVTPARVTVRQVDDGGAEVDRFVVDRPAAAAH